MSLFWCKKFLRPTRGIEDAFCINFLKPCCVSLGTFLPPGSLTCEWSPVCQHGPAPSLPSSPACGAAPRAPHPRASLCNDRPARAPAARGSRALPLERGFTSAPFVHGFTRSFTTGPGMSQTPVTQHRWDAPRLGVHILLLGQDPVKRPPPRHCGIVPCQT